MGQAHSTDTNPEQAGIDTSCSTPTGTPPNPQDLEGSPLETTPAASICLKGGLADPRPAPDWIAEHYRKAMCLPADFPGLSDMLGSLGCMFEERFEQTGNQTDAARAIEAFQKAVDLVQAGDITLPARLAYLGRAYMCRFEHLGDLSDIAGAIAAQQKAIEAAPDGYAGLHILLSTLGNSFTARFERTGDLSDSSDAIAALQRGIELTPDDHPELGARLNNLGCSFQGRFQQTGKLSDIDESITILRKAVSLNPDGRSELPGQLGNLPNAFRCRFDRTGDPSDLAEAVAMHERAVDLLPDGHPDLPKQLNNLGISLSCRFKLTGNLIDMNRAILSYRRAIALVPNGHPNQSRELGNLGNSLMARFDRTGDLLDLGDAIATHRRSVELLPDGPGELSGELCNLGNAFVRQFERTGDLSTAAEALAAHQKALDLTPADHAALPARLANLGATYIRRFRHKGDVSDINEAIAVYQKAVDSTPDGHANLPALLNGQAASLLRLFELTGDLGDIAAAIKAQRRAVELTPEGHAERPGRLDGLGRCLMHEFARTDAEARSAVINEAVEVLTRSVATAPDGHPNLPTQLHNLAESLMLRYSEAHNPVDITEAIAAQEKALELTPDGHANRPNLLFGLARKLQENASRDEGAMDASIAKYKAAASCTSGLLTAPIEGGHETLDAFDTAIQSLTLIAGLEDTVEGRYARLHNVSHFPPQAAAAACSLGRPDKALEWLEQGRCLVWTQLNNLRTPLDALRNQHEALAQRLSDVSRQLEAAASSRRISAVEMPLTDNISASDEARAHLELAKEWDELIGTVRNTVPGFENFLRPPASSTLLQHLPDSGTIVFVNVYETRCDAIILRAGQDEPTSLHLPEFSLEKAVKYKDKLSLVLKQRGLRLRDTVDSSGGVNGEDLGRGIRRFERKDETGIVLSILENLWKEIVKPVLSALEFPVLNAESETLPPRIWWCPTGPLSFLPLHAAGIYKIRSPESIFDYAVSSYTPTATSITDLVKNNCAIIDASVSGLLLTSQPNAPGAPSIPGVTGEVRSLYTLVTEHGVRSLKLEGSSVTVPEFLEHMDGYSSVHMACHASQHATQPLQSRFLFHEGSLDLAAINRKVLRHADLAFLSACQTSTGGENLTEEAVHLAAGMLAAGYRRVVATMWAIKDQHAPDVASDFYNYITGRKEEGGGSGFDGSLSAYALHHAIQQLRKKLDNSEQSLLAWIPYVHFGL